MLGVGFVRLVGDVGRCGVDLAHTGGAAEGEDSGDVHGVEGNDEGVGGSTLWGGRHGDGGLSIDRECVSALEIALCGPS